MSHRIALAPAGFSEFHFYLWHASEISTDGVQCRPFLKVSFTLNNKNDRLALARANLNDRTVLRAINDISGMDWDVVSEDASSGPFRLATGHEMERWDSEANPRSHRDVARHLVCAALDRQCARLTRLSLRSAGGSPWEAETQEVHLDRLHKLKVRIINRLLQAVRNDGLAGLIALADGRDVEDVKASLTVGPSLTPDEMERLLAECDAALFAEGDQLAEDMIGQHVPSAVKLKKASSMAREWSWEVVQSPAGPWFVRGGRQFSAALSSNSTDETDTARTLVARAIQFLVRHMTHEIATIKQSLPRFEADTAIHHLVCDRIKESVRRDGYGGLGRLLARHI